MKLHIFLIAFWFSLKWRSSQSFSTPSPRGPKGDSPSRRSRPKRPRTSSRNPSSSASGPKGERTQRQRRRRPVIEKQEVFDAKALTEAQKVNVEAIPLDLSSCKSIRRRVEAEPIVIQGGSLAVLTAPSHPTLEVESQEKGSLPITHDHYRLLSLSELFPQVPDFSQVFWTNSKFREDIRGAMRRDIFYSTPAYTTLSPKVASIMLDDDSSLQGSWRCWTDHEDSEETKERMVELSQVLQEALGKHAPSGDEFVMTLGNLCGIKPSNHWMDIIGVKDREISHSWHQDTGCSYESSASEGSTNGLEVSRYTVMLGFPACDEYTGTGVYSHVIPLKYELLAPEGHSPNEPVLFQGTADEQHIVRPDFGYGKEVLVYRDVDVLHSAPDVAYRSSIMRFM